MDEMQASGKKLAKNTSLFLLGSIGSKLLGYLLIPFYTSILSTEDYGICDTIFITVSLLYPILTLSIGESVFRFSIDKTTDQSKVWTVGVIIASIGFLVSFAFSPLLLLAKKLSPFYWLFIGYYFAVIIETLFSQYAKGCNRVRDNTIAGLTSTLLRLVMIIAFLKWFEFGILGYFIAHIVSCFFTCILLFILLGAKQFKICRVDKKLVNSMLKYSIPIIPNAVSWWISTSSDKYIINYYCGYGVTGVYAISYKIPSLMTTLTSVFLNAWQITSAEEIDSEYAETIFNKIYRLFFTVLVFAVAILIPLSRLLSRILFAKEFFNAWYYVPILLFAYLFHDLSAFIGSTYTASKKTRIIFVSTLIGAITNVLLNIMLISIYGAIGAAIATLISYYIVWMIRIINSAKILKISINIAAHFISFFFIGVEIILEMMDSLSLSLTSMICILIIVLANYPSMKDLYATSISIFKSVFFSKRKKNRTICSQDKGDSK